MASCKGSSVRVPLPSEPWAWHTCAEQLYPAKKKKKKMKNEKMKKNEEKKKRSKKKKKEEVKKKKKKKKSNCKQYSCQRNKYMNNYINMQINLDPATKHWVIILSDTAAKKKNWKNKTKQNPMNNYINIKINQWINKYCGPFLRIFMVEWCGGGGVEGSFSCSGVINWLKSKVGIWIDLHGVLLNELGHGARWLVQLCSLLSLNCDPSPC